MPLDSSWQSRARLGLDEETESLNIITEPSLHSSSLARAFLSQLTTPRATPLLSPEPGSLWSVDNYPPGSQSDPSWSPGPTWPSSTAPTSRLATPGPGAHRRHGRSSALHGAEEGLESRGSSASQQPLYLSYYLGLDRLGMEEEEGGWGSSEEDEDKGQEWERSRSAPVRSFAIHQLQRVERPQTAGLVV